MTPSIDTSDGIRLSYDDEGSGQPVVFIHGWAATRRFWEKRDNLLPPGLRIIAVDLRGHGGSSKDDGLDYSVERMSKDVEELLNALDAKRPLMVGHSLGGIIAAICSEEAAGLVLTGVSQKIQAPILRLRILMKMRWLAERVVTPRMFAPGADEELLDFVRAESARSPAGVLVEVARQTMGSELPLDLGSRQLPLLVVAGEYDSLVPPGRQELMASQLGGRFELVDNAGHNLMLERPVEFYRIIEGFARDFMPK